MVDIEGSFLLISRLNAYVIETPVDVQLSEVFGFAKLCYKFEDQG